MSPAFLGHDNEKPEIRQILMREGWYEFVPVAEDY